MKNFLFLAFFVMVTVTVPSQTSQPADRSSSAPPTELGPAAARADEARKKAADFESSSYFPSDWEAAEARYAEAVKTPSVNAYNVAADAFNSLFGLTVPLYAQAKEDGIVALRDELISNGLRDAVPEYFTLADKTAVLAMSQYEAKDYYAAKDTADKAFMMYQTLSIAYNALLVREEIHERGFGPFDPDDFDRAGQKLNEAMDAYEDGDVPLAYKSANEALEGYHLVLSTVWATYAELRSLLAKAERQAALDVKANIAARDVFIEANTSYTEGTGLLDSQNYQEAAMQFINAETLFITASVATAEKRRNATEAIIKAYETIEKSAETARQAGIIFMEGRKK